MSKSENKMQTSFVISLSSVDMWYVSLIYIYKLHQDSFVFRGFINYAKRFN